MTQPTTNWRDARPYVQVAYIVPDVEEAAREWVVRGAGPFFVHPYGKQGAPLHFRRAANLDHISAFGQYGALMVELIQPLGDAPSVGSEQTPAAFVDARPQLGHLIELCQDTPQLRHLYELVAKAAEAWDGADPVRPLEGPTR